MKFVWRKEAEGKHARCSHSAVVLGQSLLSFGGFDGAAPSGNMLRFDIDNLKGAERAKAVMRLGLVHV